MSVCQCIDDNFYSMFRVGLLVINEVLLYCQIFIDGFIVLDKIVVFMFFLYEDLSDWDEYGEVINFDDYVVKDIELMDY